MNHILNKPPISEEVEKWLKRFDRTIKNDFNRAVGFYKKEFNHNEEYMMRILNYWLLKSSREEHQSLTAFHVDSLPESYFPERLHNTPPRDFNEFETIHPLRIEHLLCGKIVATYPSRV